MDQYTKEWRKIIVLFIWEKDKRKEKNMNK